MHAYHHLLVLIHDKQDGQLLLDDALRIAKPENAKITVCHLGVDYQAMNYVSDSVMNDAQSDEVIDDKALLSDLVGDVDYPVETTLLVSFNRMQELNQFIVDNHVDLLMVGHKNRFWGALGSEAIRFINNTHIDVLIKHLSVGE